jgi:hypothetical protein
MKRLSLMGVLFLMLSGCFTTTLVAPPGKPIRLMAEEEKAHFQTEFKDWYILAGLIPLYRHDLAKLIEEEHLVEVRVRTEDRISDGLITLATELLELIFPLFPQTIVVEGNTAEQKAVTTLSPELDTKNTPVVPSSH